MRTHTQGNDNNIEEQHRRHTLSGREESALACRYREQPAYSLRPGQMSPLKVPASKEVSALLFNDRAVVFTL